VQYTANSVVLFVDSTYEADFDRDGDVDGDDLAMWEQSYGDDTGGDANSDSDSDGQDFLVWQRQLGLGGPMATIANTAAAAAVPEPASGPLAAVIAIAVAACFRPKRRPGVVLL
jgi:hypothetical protein